MEEQIGKGVNPYDQSHHMVSSFAMTTAMRSSD